MYTRILAPLDGSRLSEQVLPAAQSLSKGLQASIDLFHVLEAAPQGLNLDRLPDELRAVISTDRISEGMRTGAQDYLDGIARSLRKDPRLIVSSMVSDGGSPAERIVDEAAKHPATLIAMTTHGRSGLVRWLLGSVALKVAQAAVGPVLLVRAKAPEDFSPDFRLSTIIVPLDGSPLAEQALPHAGALAKALNVKVLLVRVAPAMGQYYIWPQEIAIPDAAEGVDRHAKGYLRRVGSRLRRQHYPSVDERLLHGDPAAGIVDLAREVPGSLVAMTSHGRSGAGRWLLGSVADRVVCHSGGPVLLIRAAQSGRMTAAGQ